MRGFFCHESVHFYADMAIFHISVSGYIERLGMQNNGRIAQVTLIVLLSMPLSCLALNNQSPITPETADLYEKALVEFNNGEIATATIYLKNVLLESPSYLSAHILLGKVYLEQGFGTLAEKELKRAEELGADKSAIHGHLAQSLVLQVKYRDILDQIFPLGISKEDDAAMMVYRGQAYFQLSDPEKATQEFNDALSIYPESVDALLGLATVQLANSNFKEAEVFINQAIDINHQNASAWYVKGAFHHAQNQIEQATIAYEVALNIEPEHFNAKLALAGLFMDKPDYRSAIDAFSKLYADAPENPQVAYFLSVAHLKMGENEKAKKFMQEAKTHLEVLPLDVINDHGPTLMLAGLIHYDLGEYQTAKAELNNFTARYPADFRARLMLGRLYILEAAWSKAVAILEPALRYHPKNYQILLLLGDAYMKKKDYFKASQVFDQAALYYPNDVSLITKSGLNNILRGETEEGINQLNSAVELSDQASSAGFMLVTNLLKQGEITEALTVVRRLSEKSPGNLLILNLRATTELQAGFRDEARKTWELILSKDPEFTIAKINLVKLDINEGNLEKAGKNLFLLQSVDPENVIYLYDFADIQLRKNELDAAIKTLEKALSIDPKNFKVTDRLVNLYIDRGEPGKAVKIASKFAGEYFEHAGSYYLLGKSQIAFGESYKAVASLKKASTLASYDSPFLKQIAKLQLDIDDINGSVHSINKYLSQFRDDPEAWHVLALAKMSLEIEANIDEPVKELKRLGLEALANQLLGDLAYQQLDYKTALGFYRTSLKQRSIEDTAQRVFTTISAIEGMAAGADFLAQWMTENPNALLTREVLAQAYVTTKQYGKAQIQLEILVGARWESPVTIVNLAYVYQITNNAKAKQYALQAVELSPENPFALDIMGWVLVKQNELDSGLKYLREAYARDSQSPTIKYHIAYVLNKLGRNSEAETHLLGIVDLKESFDEQVDAKRLLSVLQE